MLRGFFKANLAPLQLEEKGGHTAPPPHEITWSGTTYLAHTDNQKTL